jgi:molybdenum cofactor cytidylyltransferase
MELWQLALADKHVYYPDSQSFQLPLNLPSVTLLTGAHNSRSVYGLSPEDIRNVLDLANERHMPLLIEADGARRHPVKAPAEHEPPIPEFVDVVIVTVGLSALGHALTSEWVHRSEIFSDLSGSPAGSPILPETLQRVLCHPSGGLKNIPKGARRVVLLNQADNPDLRKQARDMASELINQYQAVIVSTLLESGHLPQGWISKQESKRKTPEIHAVYQPVAGIILAQGAPSTVGQPKHFRSWQGEPLIRYVARTALEAGLSPILVVTGSNWIEIHAALENLPVQIIPNPSWEADRTTSVRAGIQAIPHKINAAVILCGDQSEISAELLRALVDEHAQTQQSLTFPSTGGRQTFPVLIDRAMFPKILKLPEEAPSHAYPVHFPSGYSVDLILQTVCSEDK